MVVVVPPAEEQVLRVPVLQLLPLPLLRGPVVVRVPRVLLLQGVDVESLPGVDAGARVLGRAAVVLLLLLLLLLRDVVLVLLHGRRGAVAAGAAGAARLVQREEVGVGVPVLELGVASSSASSPASAVVLQQVLREEKWGCGWVSLGRNIDLGIKIPHVRQLVSQMYNLLSYLEESRIISEIVWTKKGEFRSRTTTNFVSFPLSLSLPHTQSLIGANCQNNPTRRPSSGDILNSPAVLLIRIRQTGTRLRVIAPSRAVMPPSFPPPHTHTHIKSFCCCIHSNAKVPRRGAKMMAN